MTKREEARAALADVKEREEAATKGPWICEKKSIRMSCYATIRTINDTKSEILGCGFKEPVDSEYAAHARADLPLFVAAFKEHEKILTEVDALTEKAETIAKKLVEYFERKFDAKNHVITERDKRISELEKRLRRMQSIHPEYPR